MKTVPLTLTNLLLIIVGTLALSIGLYRTAPLKIDKSFYWQNGPLVFFLLIGLYFFILRYEPGAAAKWENTTAMMAGRFLPLMILLCFVMGIGGILAGMYKKEIIGYLTRHDWLAPLLGSFFAPTPNSVVPIIENMWTNKTLTPNFLFFLNAASLMSVPLFMLRSVGFRNPEISLKMYMFGCTASLLIFPLRYPISWFIDWLKPAL